MDVIRVSIFYIFNFYTRGVCFEVTSRGEQTESNSYENRFLPHSSSFFLLRHQPPQIRQMAAPKFGKVAVHNFPLSYYYKVATASFVCGAAVEAFMIHTCVRMKIQKSPLLILIILTFLSLFLSFLLFLSFSLSINTAGSTRKLRK